MELIDLRKQYQILKGIRSELIGIRNIFDEKYKECETLKNDIKKGGFASKYREMEFVESTQALEFIRIEFDKKYKEFNGKKEKMDHEKILDIRYKEIKQREYELLDEFNKIDAIRLDYEEKENELDHLCTEYEEIKKHTFLINNMRDRYDPTNMLYKKTTHCLKQITNLENEIRIKRQLYELRRLEDLKKKEENNRDMAEFFDICETLEDIELEEGILL